MANKVYRYQAVSNSSINKDRLQQHVERGSVTCDNIEDAVCIIAENAQELEGDCVQITIDIFDAPKEDSIDGEN